MLVSLFAVWQARRRAFLLVGWLWFLGTLVPVIGFLQVGAQSMSDRFVYVPLIGLFIMVAWGAADCFSRHKKFLTVGAIMVLLAAVSATIFQLGFWRSSETLFARNAQLSSGNHFVWLNLGAAYADRQKMEDAIVCYRNALTIKSDYIQAHYNLGNALGVQGKLDEAVAQYEETLRLDPRYADAHFNWANALSLQGKLAAAEEHFRTALRLSLDFA